MDIAKIGTQLLMKKLGLSGDSSLVTSALSGLLGGDDKGEGIDIASLVTSMQGKGGGMMSMVTSFLGDGDNDSMQESDIGDLFDNDKLGEFASKLGIDHDTASKGLSDAIPSMIDNASKGGELLEMFGGVKGILGTLKKFL